MGHQVAEQLAVFTASTRSFWALDDAVGRALVVKRLGGPPVDFAAQSVQALEAGGRRLRHWPEPRP